MVSIYALRRRPCAYCGHTFAAHGTGRCGSSGWPTADRRYCSCYAFRCDDRGSWLLGTADDPSPLNARRKP